MTFRLGLRAVSAVRTESRMVGLPNLVFVRLVPSLLDQLLPQLPGPMLAALRWLFPGLFLPAHLVLKREKRGMEEEFVTERDLYRRGALSSVQGTHTPVFYGEVRCPETETTGGRALVLSDVGGISLEEAAAGGLKIPRLEAMLLESFGALAAAGVSNLDYRLQNYRLVNDRVVFLEFGRASIVPPGSDVGIVVARSVSRVALLYHCIHDPGGPTPRSVAELELALPVALRTPV